MLFTIIGCESKKDNGGNNKDVKEPLTKEEILKIESDYLNSENLFTFDSYSRFSNSGTTSVGKVGKGSFGSYDVVSYVDKLYQRLNINRRLL